MWKTESVQWKHIKHMQQHSQSWNDDGLSWEVKHEKKIKHQKNKSVTTCVANLNPQLFNLCVFFKIGFVEHQIQECYS